VNRVHICDLGGADDAICAEIAVRAFGPTDADGLVGELDVERLDVGLRVDGERLDAQFPAGANYAKGDFTAIGDEDLLNHWVLKNEAGQDAARLDLRRRRA
jgi:hypothetical protein